MNLFNIEQEVTGNKINDINILFILLSHFPYMLLTTSSIFQPNIKKKSLHKELLRETSHSVRYLPDFDLLSVWPWELERIFREFYSVLPDH
jgi:hypothetical protein